MAETDLHDADAAETVENERGEGEQFDEENRLKPEFVRDVREAPGWQTYTATLVLPAAASRSCSS